MVGNEVKQANDDDHGEFEGTTATTDCRWMEGGREMVFRQDGQSENCGQFRSTHPEETFLSMSIQQNINVFSLKSQAVIT